MTRIAAQLREGAGLRAARKAHFAEEDRLRAQLQEAQSSRRSAKARQTLELAELYEVMKMSGIPIAGDDYPPGGWPPEGRPSSGGGGGEGAGRRGGGGGGQRPRRRRCSPEHQSGPQQPPPRGEATGSPLVAPAPSSPRTPHARTLRAITLHARPPRGASRDSPGACTVAARWPPGPRAAAPRRSGSTMAHAVQMYGPVSPPKGSRGAISAISDVQCQRTSVTPTRPLPLPPSPPPARQRSEVHDSTSAAAAADDAAGVWDVSQGNKNLILLSSSHRVVSEGVKDGTYNFWLESL